uniref:Uncharacterized protein n=1 Tax=Equus asinus TaxID=9793 RepID=A0A8C4L6S2_EQUAS
MASARAASCLRHLGTSRARARPQLAEVQVLGAVRAGATRERTRREEVRQEGVDSPAAPREPQLRSRSAQLRGGPDAAPAPSSPSEEPFSPAPPPRLLPPSSMASAVSSVPSFRRFF